MRVYLASNMKNISIRNALQYIYFAFGHTNVVVSHTSIIEKFLSILSLPINFHTYIGNNQR